MTQKFFIDKTTWSRKKENITSGCKPITRKYYLRSE